MHDDPDRLRRSKHVRFFKMFKIWYPSCLVLQPSELHDGDTLDLDSFGLGVYLRVNTVFGEIARGGTSLLCSGFSDATPCTALGLKPLAHVRREKLRRNVPSRQSHQRHQGLKGLSIEGQADSAVLLGDHHIRLRKFCPVFSVHRPDEDSRCLENG